MFDVDYVKAKVDRWYFYYERRIEYKSYLLNYWLTLKGFLLWEFIVALATQIQEEPKTTKAGIVYALYTKYSSFATYAYLLMCNVLVHIENFKNIFRLKGKPYYIHFQTCMNLYIHGVLCCALRLKAQCTRTFKRTAGAVDFSYPILPSHKLELLPNEYRRHAYTYCMCRCSEL